eukprot:g13.t1
MKKRQQNRSNKSGSPAKKSDGRRSGKDKEKLLEFYRQVARDEKVLPEAKSNFRDPLSLHKLPPAKFDSEEKKSPRTEIRHAGSLHPKKRWTPIDLACFKTLLASKGFDFENGTFLGEPIDSVEDLSLQIFDDTQHESRVCLQDWTRSVSADKRFSTKTAKAFGLRMVIGEDRRWSGEWIPCSVLRFDETRAYNKFSVRWEDRSDEDRLPRICLFFLSEDEVPQSYAERLVKTFTTRREALRRFRYEHFVKSMPTEDCLEIDKDRMGRIAEIACDTQLLRSNRTLLTAVVDGVARRAQSDFAQEMNRIVFDMHVSSNATQKMLTHIADFSRNRTKESVENMAARLLRKPFVPSRGCVHVVEAGDDNDNKGDDGNFFRTESVLAFFENTMLREAQIVRAFEQTRAECARVKNVCAYQLFERRTESLLRKSFVAKQRTYVKRTLNGLEDKWCQKIKSQIEKTLGSVESEHFVVTETNRSKYESSPLKPFFSTVNYMMEDAMRFMIMGSVRKYVRALISTPYELPNTTVKEIRSGDDASDDVVPLFALEVQLQWPETPEAKIAFSESPESFADVASDVLYAPLDEFSRMTQVERRVMNRLFWRSSPTIACVEKDETWISDANAQIRACILNCAKPVNGFLETLSTHLDFAKTSVQAYADDIRAEFIPEDGGNMDEEAVMKLVDRINERTEYHARKVEELQASIPDKVHINHFSVNCVPFRSYLVKKHRQTRAVLLEMLASSNNEACRKLIDLFGNIISHLHNPVTKIEELSDMADYMNESQSTIGELWTKALRVLDKFELLDDLKYQLSQDDFDARWNLFGMPCKIHQLMQSVSESNAKKKVQYAEAMKKKQGDFTTESARMDAKVQMLQRFTDIAKHDEYAKEIQAIDTRLLEMKQQAQLFNSREALFGMDTTEYSRISATRKTFEQYKNLWQTVHGWIVNKKKWFDQPLLDNDADMIERSVASSMRFLSKCEKTFQKSGLDKCAAIATETKKELTEFKPLVPLLTAIVSPAMRLRHWDELSKKLNVELDPDADDFTLKNLLKKGFAENEAIVIKAGEVANKEYQIELALRKMKSEWADVDLVLEEYRDTGTHILKEIDPVIALLDDHITMTQTMTFSSFKKPFEEEIADWDKTLNTVSEVVEEWLATQRSWLYLQPIFESNDIKKQLPTEAKRFLTVDKNWRHAMSEALKRPLAIAYCDNAKLYEKFVESNQLLDLVQKGLNDYLETKREGFSRFYFLSNDELLEILSETRDPTRVQPHLKKCFEAIKSVNFNQDLEITAMMSREKEVVDFVRPVPTKGKSVEGWMNDLEYAMQLGVKHKFNEAVVDYRTRKRTDWIQKWPGQCVLNCSQVHWTQETEDAINAKGTEGVKACLEKQLEQLKNMIELVRTPGLPKLAKKSLSSLAVIDVHAKDVTVKMVEEKVASTNAFLWLSQMKYYWLLDEPKRAGDEMIRGTLEGEEPTEFDRGDAYAVMVTSKRPYSYEYLGNSFRLVITPLTDKCYLTLMGAVEMILGGAPAGPAGTGKTETVKDLAKGLAKQCVVFNCSDGMDYKMTAKFFKGLSSCGAWCCFDEFNRIHIEVLSVIAQQIMTLQKAVWARQPRTMFDGTDVRVNWQFAVFITMNPGYAGRTELPDNLKALFRPIAMMVPDYALIGEIMLFAYGFFEARKCAQKMVATFRLCSEQCSNQSHYDYGMRAVKTVIVAAGNLKSEQPDADEELLMLRGLMDVNLPKFLAHDLPLFKGIMSDLFPGKSKPQIDYGSLLACIKNACANQNKQASPWFVEKIIQLYEMIVVRHGLMVVGPTGGGKSSNIKVLEEALTMLKCAGESGKRYEKVQIKYINPKSIKMTQLYGSFDENTHEWRDGVLANMIRQCTKQQNSDLKWVVFDGPVDTLWIESMNTVLDDNKKLCLNSGEIVPLSPEMTMMFEPADLAVASPATVSRCGMIYMEPESLGLDPIILSWLNTVPDAIDDDVKQSLVTCIENYLKPVISFLRRNLREWVPTTDGGLTSGLFKLLDCYLVDFRCRDGSEPPSPEYAEKFAENVEALFVFCLVWSVCCTVNKQGRSRFDAFIRTQLALCGCKRQLPSNGLVYDYRFDLSRFEWVPWTDYAQKYEHNSSLAFNELVVQTMDTVRYTYVFDTLITNDRHVLVCGPTGTGKTVNVSRHLQTGMEKKYIPLCMTFSAQTSANQVQDTIDGKMDKRRKGVFGPMAGKRYIVFIDDCNMPQPEIFGAQMPIELLRQWMCFSGWYDRKTLKWRKIIDTAFVLACGPPEGGRNPVTPRFFRHFNVITYTMMEDRVIASIFETILSSFLSSFSEEIQSISSKITWATIDVFNTSVEKLLPTPTKPHYTFNLRDLAKVFQGILMVSSRKMTTSIELARTWVHESRRVFQDRLINDADRKWFDSVIRAKVKDVYDMSIEEVLPTENLLYCDFMIPGADPRYYWEVKDPSQIVPVVKEYLGDYNAESKNPMNLVLFLDAIKHVARISRVLRQPLGNALLLGVGGSGRQSLTRLATFISEYELFQVSISKGYGKTEWLEDLRTCLLKAGVDDQPVVFLFVDTQIVFEEMLEDINNILNSGDVPNIYGPEEREQIINTCRLDCQKKRIPPTKTNIFAQYIIRVRRNIHCVLALSPVGDDFRRRLRMFPSLVNCCTIDWFSEWPDEALYSVAQSAMTRENMDLGESLAPVVDFFREIHQSVARYTEEFRSRLGRHNYVTPTSYLELLDTYKKVIKTKRVEVGGLRNKLQNGLNKIKSTQDAVEDLQIKLEKMAPELEATQKEVEAMIAQIEIDKVEADGVKKVVLVTEAEASKQAAISKAIADDAQRDLDEALPALEEAVACLNLLKQSDIDEVKAMKSPPDGVKLTMEVCCVIFLVKPIMEKDPNKLGGKIKNYFAASKKSLLGLGAKAFLKMLFDFDKDNMAEKTAKKLSVYCSNSDFEPKQISKASKACTAICMWARAMLTYHRVAKEVEPKRQKLAVAQAELGETMAKLKEANKKLDAVNTKLSMLEDKLNESLRKKESLAKQVQLCSDRLERADVLIGGLSGERVRWGKTVNKLQTTYTNLKGDCLVASGTIAYLGPFTPMYRKKIVDYWSAKLGKVASKLPSSDAVSLQSVLANPVQICSWNILGLPSDNHSCENAIIMSTARRWPLLIDPQQQANRFIRNMGKDKTFSEGGMEIIKLTDPNFLRSLENGIRFGKWILLENILEKLDASLNTLLEKQLFKEGGALMIRIGDNNVPWNDAFKFFMTTKLPNPHYPPEVCVKVSLLNFTITPKGLEDQLLGVVIGKEAPELERKKTELVVSNAKMKEELQNIEDMILKLLDESKGNVLDDVALIETLAKAKQTSSEIQAKVAEAELTEREIDETREQYRPVAFRGSLLYFCIANLCSLDPMYQYSLQWFSRLFSVSVDEAPQAMEVAERVDNLIDFFTYKLYVNVCRSLFEKHKLLFSFIMVVNILRGNDEIDSSEWRFLISGIANNPVEIENPEPAWITKRTWTYFCALSSIKAFKGLAETFKENVESWKNIFDSSKPQEENLPGKWDNLESIQKLCILNCIRPDKMTYAIQSYVSEKLSEKFVEPPPFNLKVSYADSRPTSPLIFVLVTGSDPTKMFYSFAEEMGMGGERSPGISLGQGQDKAAEHMISEGVEKGHWVYLQNCHLYVSWMSKLEQICEGLDPDETHPDFRLWLTSMPSKAFPVAILQNGVKMSLEPPKGLKSNLKNAYFALSDDRLQITSKPRAYNKLFFALCFFHASVQDRRKFGSLGWNIPYEFNDTDLEISKAQLEKFIDLYDEVPYRVLNTMISYINYGGRVTDYIDLRTIDVMLRNLYKEDVMSDDYKFSSSGLYRSVEYDEKSPHSKYMAYIDQLPLNPSPEAFGLHENAEIICAETETRETFASILSLEAKDSSGSGKSAEEIIDESAAIIMSRMAPAFDVESVRMAYPLDYRESMNTVLLQECMRYNPLIVKINSSLPQLRKALKGLVVMTQELEEISNALLTQNVPESWAALAYPSLKGLDAWVAELVQRCQFLQDWYDNGIPAVFWVSGFYFPQAFFTGTLQNFARKMTVPIDTLSFDFVIHDDMMLEDFTERPEDGCRIHGLFLEGARWNATTHTLDDSFPKQLYTSAPIIHLVPKKDRAPPDGGIYRCPVYKELSRRGTLSTTGHSTNFVMWLELPGGREDIKNNLGMSDQEYWIKAGVAMFCALAY